MSYNLKVWNQDGIEQFDAISTAFQFVQGGTIYVPGMSETVYSNYAGIGQGAATGVHNVLYFPNYGVKPIFAIGNTNGFGIVVQELTNNYVRLFLRNPSTAMVASAVGGTNPGTTIPYKIFVPAQNISASTESYGLRLYTDTGAVAYDSGRPIINTVYYTTVNIGAVEGQVTSAQNLSARPLGTYTTSQGTGYSDVGATRYTGYNGIYVVVDNTTQFGPAFGVWTQFLGNGYFFYIPLTAKYIVNANNFIVDLGTIPYVQRAILANVGTGIRFFGYRLVLKAWAIK